jgi:molybdopterin-guanine dinucleotide biosynthesis protein A
MNIATSDITGLILAGGLGSRMGGADKGLQEHRGTPLALHALRRLAPQVESVMISANRNIAVYEAMGASVWADEIGGFGGPLAGILAGLAHCHTPYMATVPCDAPNFPLDLIGQLARGLADAGADMAMAVTREGPVARRQPVFSLMNVSVRESAIACMRTGQGNVGRWATQQRSAEVIFEDGAAFFNANTLADLAQLSAGPG